MAGDPPNKFKSEKEVQRCIKEMQKECVVYKSKTEKQKKIESDLDAEISRMSATIDKYRAEIGGTMALKENAAAVKQQIDIMQRRLVHAQRRNLDAKGELENVVKEVNSVRRDIIHMKRHRELLEKDTLAAEKLMNRIANDMIEMNARAEQCEQIEHSLLEEAENFAHQSRAELRKIEGEKKIVAVLEDVEASNKPDPVSIGEKLGGLSLEKENEIREKVSEAADWRQSTQVKLRLAKEKINSYRSLFENIKEVTGSKDLDSFVEKFRSKDDSNFRLLKFVNNLEAERRQLSKQIEESEEKLQKLVEGKHSSAEDAVAMLQARIFETQKKQEYSEKRMKHLNQQALVMQDGVKALYNLIAPKVESSNQEEADKMKNETGKKKKKRKPPPGDSLQAALLELEEEEREAKKEKEEKMKLKSPPPALCGVVPPKMFGKLLGIIEFRTNIIIAECVHKQQEAAAKLAAEEARIAKERVKLENEKMALQKSREKSLPPYLRSGNNRGKRKNKEKVKKYIHAFGVKNDDTGLQDTDGENEKIFIKKSEFKGTLPKTIRKSLPLHFTNLVTRGPDFKRRNIREITRATSKTLREKEKQLLAALNRKAVNDDRPLTVAELQNEIKAKGNTLITMNHKDHITKKSKDGKDRAVERKTRKKK
eukprot:g912.t1